MTGAGEHIDRGYFAGEVAVLREMGDVTGEGFGIAGDVDNPGRRKLRGFLRYIAEHGLDWQLHFVRRREDFSAQFVASFRERGAKTPPLK